MKSVRQVGLCSNYHLRVLETLSSLIDEDVFLRNLRGLGRQVILDVAVTGIDGQFRISDEASDRPLQLGYE